MKRVLKVKKEQDLISFLIENTDYSSKKLKSMITHDQIKVNNKRPKLPFLLKETDCVDITTDKIYNTPFSIVYEDEELLVVNKKSGLLTVSTDHEKEITLYHQVYSYLHAKGEKVFIVHRLDKETSGIVLFAKKEATKRVLQENWNDIITTRKYIAVVHGEIKNKGEIKSYLKEEKNTFVHSGADGKLAITEYKPLKRKDGLTLLDVNLKTGRKNQIRVHMKENNTPVVGDKKYGRKDTYSRLMLHAYELSFIHPKTKHKFKFSVPIPKDFLNLF